MKRAAILALGLLPLGLLAAGPAAADTLLRLSASARVMVHPDELDATLRAEAIAPSAATVQAKVNADMEAALTLARQTQGVRVSTGAYTVWPRDPARNQGWQGSQTLNLKGGGDGVALLALVGTLQSRGLAVSRLGWQLAPETARKARTDATRQALGGLRARAEEAAGILGLHFDSFREVRLDNVRPVQPMLRAMAVGAGVSSSAPPPPAVEAEDVPVEASVEADVVLK